MNRVLSVLTLTAALTFNTLARADLVTHALVSFGDSEPTTVQVFGAAHAAISNSYTSPGSFTGTAEAWAGYGLVRAVASAHTQNASYDTQLVQAEASFSDLLTISGGVGGGFVIYQYTVTGSTIGSEHQAHAHAFLRHGNEPDEELGHLSSSTILTSLPHSFTFGVPFTTGLLLSAEVHLHHGHSGTALADFSAGAMLSGISIFDAQMQPISQFSISAHSGTQDPLPAPATAPVLLAGLCLVNRRS